MFIFAIAMLICSSIAATSHNEAITLSPNSESFTSAINLLPLAQEQAGEVLPTSQYPVIAEGNSVITQNPSRTLRTTNLHPIIEESVDIREMSREDIAEIRSRLAILGRTSRRRFPGAGLRDPNQSFITKH
jgi:hypothetical protein